MPRSPVPKVFLAGVLLFTAPFASAGVQHAIARSEFAALHRPLRNGARVTIPRIPLADGEPDATLEVERFQVWADRVEIKVYGANNEVIETLAPPAMQYFRGTIAGKPDSLVFLSVHGENLEGVIYTADRKFALGTRRFDRNSTRVIIQESSVVDDIPADGQGYTCDLDGTMITPASNPREVMSNAIPDLQPNAAPTGTQRSVLNIAVDTDYELYTRPGIASNATALATYIGNLMGGVSTIYSRDLRTEVRIAYLGIQTSASDPFHVVPTGTGPWNGSPSVVYTAAHALAELGDRWHNSPPSSVPRSGAMLISGKPQTSGIAWINTLCDPDFGGNGEVFNGHWGGGYAYNGGIAPPANLGIPNPDVAPYTSPSSNYWPLLQVSHELGHNVGSAHTHCVLLTPEQRNQYNVTRAYVDTCASGAGCYSGVTSIPAEKGTIMSYCHLAGGSQTRFTFGQPNEASDVITTNMRSYMAAETPSMSAITAPTSLGAGVTGNASVMNAAGLTYAWTISNGTITSAANAAAITFTGSTSPVVLTVTATNTSGCGITDSASVTIGTSLAAPTNLIATVTPTGNVALTWNAVTGATGYDIYRRASIVAAFAPVGSIGTNSFNDDSVSANTAYLYQVRATGGAFSTSELATTTIFTDPTIVAGSTTLKSVHVTQLLTAVNAVRTLAGLGAATFSTPATVLSTATSAHLTALRTGVDAARTTLGLGNTAYTDAVLIPGSTRIRAAHINELRTRVQ